MIACRRFWIRLVLACSIALLLPALPQAVLAQSSAPSETLFRNVRVLDVVKGELGPATDVLVRGSTIAAIGSSLPASPRAAVIEGQGRTLMPGLIDAHVHIGFGSLLLTQLYDPKTTPDKIGAAMANSARQMLLRGFTAVRRSSRSSAPSTPARFPARASGPRAR
jgi:imidazolonepropionase-like amidohydrolase